MDEEHLAALRQWGEGLRVDDRHEVRAAGKAIVLLCDDVERLERELWHLRAMAIPRGDRSAEVDAVESDLDCDEASADTDDPVAALKARFRRVRSAVIRR